MKEIAEKLRVKEQSMAEEKGPFDLFALFLREDAPNKWDLVVAAKWISENKESALKYIATSIHDTLSHDELLSLSRIAIIDESNPALGAFQGAMHIEHGIVEIQDSNFSGLQIKHAYLITSKRRGENVHNKAL